MSMSLSVTRGGDRDLLAAAAARGAGARVAAASGAARVLRRRVGPPAATSASRDRVVRRLRGSALVPSAFVSGFALGSALVLVLGFAVDLAGTSPRAWTRRRRRTGAGARPSARRWTRRRRLACGSGSGASPARLPGLLAGLPSRPVSWPASAFGRAARCGEVVPPERRRRAGAGVLVLVGGGVVALALHRVALRGVLVDERHVVAAGAGGSGGAAPAPAAAAAPAAAPGGAGGGAGGVVAGGLALARSASPAGSPASSVAGRRVRGLGWGRSVVVSFESSVAAGFWRGCRGARGGRGARSGVSVVSGASGASVDEPAAASGPAAREGRAARAGSHARVRSRCRCPARRRVPSPLRSRRPFAAVAVPGGRPVAGSASPRRSSLEPVPRGRRRGCPHRLVRSRWVPRRRRCSSVLPSHGLARESRQGQEDSGSRCEPDEGSVVPVRAGWELAVPAPGRARIAHPKRPCPAPAFPRSSARRRSSAGPAGRGSRALSVSRLGGAGRAGLHQG